ncbi:MAG: HAD family hydrolase [Verrucomicrobiota bacterium]|jgi:phosphoglycolate phosphatase
MSLTVKSLFLDLDGTLIDSKPGIMESYRIAAETVLPGQAYDAAAVSVGPPLPEMFRKSFPNASKPQIEDLVKAFRQYYETEGMLRTPLFDTAADLLVLWHKQNINLFIVTNKPARISSIILDNLRISRFFRAVLAVDSIQPPFAGKAAMIQQLLRHHHLNLRDAVYVGDTGEDAAAAAACGLRFVWAAYGYGKPSPDQLTSVFGTVQRFGELAEILKRG